MNARWHSRSWAAALVVAACCWCGTGAILRAAIWNRPVNGTVVSVANDSITISVKPKNPNDPDQLTFACSAQMTKVGLKTDNGVQQVSGTSIGVGDRVAITVVLRGSTRCAGAIVIEKQAGNKGGSTANAKKP